MPSPFLGALYRSIKTTYSCVSHQLVGPDLRCGRGNFLFTQPLLPSCLSPLVDCHLASSTAFNSIAAVAVLFLNTPYAIPQGILFFQGRSKLPVRWPNLGYLGYFCSAFSVPWIVILRACVSIP
jgi:hypothetical protein